MAVTWGHRSASKGIELMPEWLPIILLLLAYVALMKWVLPHFGIPT